MKITNRIKEKCFNGTVTARQYLSETPSKNWLIWFHGMGERGPEDGSQLNLVEKLPGFPKFAKGVRPGATTSTGTVEYPFNIFAVQTEGDYQFEKNVMSSYITLHRKAEKIILGGISLGGICAIESLADFNDIGGFIKGVVNICGSGEVSRVPRTRKVPIIWWHGDKDTIVKFTDATAANPAGTRGAREFVAAYEATKGEIDFRILPGVGHNAWDYAFKDDSNLDFINRIFNA